MREAQRQIAATGLENDSLRGVLKGEKILREDRDNEETHALLFVNSDLKQNAFVSEEEKKKARKQREFVDSQVSQLDQTMKESKARVQELVSQIKQSKQHNEEQCHSFDSSLKQLLTENKQLRVSKEKQEIQTRQMEEEVKHLLNQERQVEHDWDETIKSLEQ